jgi:hypothetical protein
MNLVVQGNTLNPATIQSLSRLIGADGVEIVDAHA